jgi:small subunit ribosomal protein S5
MSENIENFEKLVHVGRNAKVVKGGRRFSFAVIVVSGNKKGKVGFGLGKAAEVLDAREKAASAAKKKMISIPLRDGRTLHTNSIGTHGASTVIMRSAPAGTGVIAGGPVRAICEALGVKDIVAKSLGSNNPHNIIKAAINALTNTYSPRDIAEKRGKKVGEIITRREKKLGDKGEVVSLEDNQKVVKKASKIKAKKQ